MGINNSMGEFEISTVRCKRRSVGRGIRIVENMPSIVIALSRDVHPVAHAGYEYGPMQNRKFT